MALVEVPIIMLLMNVENADAGMLFFYRQTKMEIVRMEEGRVADQPFCLACALVRRTLC
jgi:hypothetical protein